MTTGRNSVELDEAIAAWLALMEADRKIIIERVGVNAGETAAKLLRAAADPKMPAKCSTNNPQCYSRAQNPRHCTCVLVPPKSKPAMVRPVVPSVLIARLVAALRKIEGHGCTEYKHDIWCPACTAHAALEGRGE